MRYHLLLLFSALCFAQSSPADFTIMHANLSIDAAAKKVSGTVVYEFVARNSKDTVRIDAKSMVFKDVKLNKKIVAFKVTATQLLLYKGIKKGKNKLSFYYEATPKQTMYFINMPGETQIWTQGQGKYTSHWLPSFDDVNEKLVFNMSVSFDKDYTVISNGELMLDKKKDSTQGKRSWSYKMQQPMSSYLVMLAIGKFNGRQLKLSGTAMELYYRPADSLRANSTYKHTVDIFNYLKNEIGVPYPWAVYKQVPVLDFLYAGMENTTATVFAQDYVVDDLGYNDRSYLNVEAHELAHQWFGDLVTAKSGKHHWLQEGFATYYALLTERALFGEDHFNWKLYEIAEDLQQAGNAENTVVLNDKASSLTFYQKGAWALHFLRESIGEANFRNAVIAYLMKYQYKNVETSDFLIEIKKVSDFDTETFSKQWLEAPGFRTDEAITLLRKNNFIESYFNLVALQDTPLEQKREHLVSVFQADSFYPLQEEVLYQLKQVPFEQKKALINIALDNGGLKVRQAVAVTMDKIPVEFYNDYKSLLNDESYITKEIVLSRLWQQFPEKQSDLLEETKHLIGFNDRNIRILWLTLALSTREYEPMNKGAMYNELLSYTSTAFESNTRQNAITNMLFLDPNDTNALSALVNPLTHHKWQFTKFARERIRALLKTERYRVYYTELLPKLPDAEHIQLDKLLKE